MSRRLGLGALDERRRGGHRRLRGHHALVGQPLAEGGVERRVGCDVGVQIRARGRNIRKILGRQRRIAHVGSAELRRVDSAHLHSSRTQRRTS